MVVSAKQFFFFFHILVLPGYEVFRTQNTKQQAWPSQLFPGMLKPNNACCFVSDYGVPVKSFIHWVPLVYRENLLQGGALH